MESDEKDPESGDVYRHTRTGFYVIVLTIKRVAGEVTVRLGRPGYGTPLETSLENFRNKFWFVGVNVLHEARAEKTKDEDSPTH